MSIITKKHGKDFFRWMLPMWIINLICFMTCLFIKDYAVEHELWYYNAIHTLVSLFGLTKIVLSFGVCAAIIQMCFFEEETLSQSNLKGNK